MDLDLPPEIQSLLGFDVGRSRDQQPPKTVSAPIPTPSSHADLAKPRPEVIATAVAGNDNDATVEQCVTAALHFECDSAHCPRHLGQAEPTWPLVLHVTALQACADGGCLLCGTYFGALYQPAAQCMWDTKGWYRNWPGKGLVLEILNASGYIRIEEVTFILTRDAKEPLGGCKALSRLRPSVRLRASPQSIEDIKSWLSECQSHPECPRLEPQLLPTRVLDLGPDPTKLEPRLACTVHAQKGYYTTLSHCWGGDVQCKTTAANFASRTQSLDPATLPPTFHHAAIITQALGIRYLWIDALCIIQGDSHDWAVESARMAAVYQGSALTIAASHGRDSSGGCFLDEKMCNGGAGLDDGLKSWPISSEQGRVVAEGVCIRCVPSHSNFGNRVFLSENIHRKVHDFAEPLLTRAWTVQERVLSPRIAHFTSSELLWECGASFRCQCGGLEHLRDQEDFVPVRLPSRVPAPRLESSSGAKGTALSLSPARPALSALWFRLAEMYSYRALTYPADRLPALSGLARAFHERGLGTYVAGHWVHALWFSLLWRPVMLERSPRPEPAVAPSWSWASICAPVHFEGLRAATDLGQASSSQRRWPVAEILHCRCEPATPDPFGRVAEGQLLVRGIVASGRVDSEARRQLTASGSADIKNDTGMFSVRADTMGDNDTHQLRELWGLVWATWDGPNPPDSRVTHVLVLARRGVDAGAGGVDTFSRVGLTRVEGNHWTGKRLETFFQGAEVRTIMLV